MGRVAWIKTDLFFFGGQFLGEKQRQKQKQEKRWKRNERRTTEREREKRRVRKVEEERKEGSGVARNQQAL